MWAIGKPAVASVVRRWLPIGLVAAVVIGTIYAYAFREPIGRLAPQDAHALRMFVQLYLTPLALALGLLGYAVLVGRSFWRAPAMILTATTFFFLFFYKIRIIPEHFWLTRRFVDIILPAALMFAAAGALLPLSRFTSAAWASKRRPEVLRYTAGTLAVLFLARAYVEAAERVRFHVEYAGLIPKLEQLAERFADDDLVLVEAREASDIHTLGLPLAYVYARNVLVLPTSRPDKPAIVRFLSWADDKYRNIYFIAGGGTDLLSRGVGSRVVASERFQVPEYERTPYDVYPRASLRKPFDFTIYQLVRGDRQAAPSTLDLGGADDLYLVDFYPKERLGSGPLTFRWTQGVSHLLMDVGAESRQVILTLQSGRPQGLGSPRVTVYLGGRELGTVVAGSGFREYPFPIPDDLAATLASQDGPDDIRIESTTWIPRDTGGGADNRALGVMVDSAQIR
jgi:hypothetical protein